MRQRILFVAALIAAGGIAACSSGGSVAPPAGSSGGGGGSAPSSSGYVVATLGSSQQTVTLAPVGGITGTVTLPAGTGTVAVQSSTTTPSGAVQVQAVAAHTPLYYLTINVTSGTLTLTGTPAFSVTLTSAPTVALNEGKATVNGSYSYWGTIGTTLAVSGSTVTAPVVSGSITLAAGQSLFLSVYSGGVIPTPAARPDNVGNTFTYHGTETTGGTYTYPSPNASLPPGVAASMPPTAGTATVTTNITVQAAPTPFFSTTASVNDVHSVETDAFALRSNITTTDAWFATSASAYSLYGSASNDGAGDTFTTQYANAQTVDQLPEVASLWTNSPAATMIETDVDGTQSTRTVNADGSYTETQLIPDELTSIITVNSDGSGSYGGTAFSTFHGRSAFIYNAPVSNVVVVQAQPTPHGASPAPSPITIATPAAFFSPSPVLYSETDALTTNVPFSNNASCAVPASFGVSGNQIVQTINRIDPVLGYTENETVTTYDEPGIGPVCIVLFDTQNYYYNYNNDDGTIVTYANVFGNGSLKSVLTNSEILNLSATTAIVPSSVTRTAQSSTQALAPSTIAFARAQFDARIAKQTRAQSNGLRTYITHVLNTLGVSQ